MNINFTLPDLNLDRDLEHTNEDNKSPMPQNSKIRPNWYKVPLPRNLAMWAIECLKEYVDISKFQRFRKVSVSCKNNGTSLFVRLLFESKMYYGGHCVGKEQFLTGLPVSYLIEVNKRMLKGNDMNYDIGKGVKYNEKFPVFNKMIEMDEESKLWKERDKLFKFIKQFDIPLRVAVPKPFSKAKAKSKQKSAGKKERRTMRKN